MGPNDVNAELQATNDVSHVTSDGREVTRGTLTWEANEAGDKTFSLVIKPRSGWEIQKTFHVSLHDIRGFPADQGHGEVSPTAGTYTLTVSAVCCCTARGRDDINGHLAPQVRKLKLYTTVFVCRFRSLETPTAL